MATITAGKAEALRAELDACTGWHTRKTFDWEAFPASQGFPELARCQMRYVGAGGSPKADDPTTLRPGRFTLSLVHQPVGKYGASHAHEVEEAFLVLEGVQGAVDVLVLTGGGAHGVRPHRLRAGGARRRASGAASCAT